MNPDLGNQKLLEIVWAAAIPASCAETINPVTAVCHVLICVSTHSQGLATRTKFISHPTASERSTLIDGKHLLQANPNNLTSESPPSLNIAVWEKVQGYSKSLQLYSKGFTIKSCKLSECPVHWPKQYRKHLIIRKNGLFSSGCFTSMLHQTFHVTSSRLTYS